MPYIPHTSEDIENMLSAIGKKSLEELFKDIPQDVRLKKEYDIPSSLSEPELLAHASHLASRNRSDRVCFMGAGTYQHFIPVLIDYLAGRSEFWTAYTPYQPETSQGGLQSIFEFQTGICELTGMDVSNASMYDGPTALAEAILISHSHHRQKRGTFLLPASLHPEYREVVATYVQNMEDVKLVTIPEKNGLVDLERLSCLLDAKTAAVVLSSPNFYGLIENGRAIVEMAHKAGALAISVVNPISLGALASPGSYNADIAVGDGQPLGVPMGYGGPSFGFIAAKKEFMRKMPGRIVGQTVDGREERGFVLTLQTREQHIRREKATSNICSNEALMAFRGLLYMVILGKEGLCEVADQCIQKAHYLASRIENLPGYGLVYPGAPFFHEFVVKCPKPAAEILAHLEQLGILGGVALERWYPERKNELSIAVTECRTRQEMDTLVENLGKIAGCPQDLER